MAWVKATHKVTGEFHYDSTPDVLDADQYDMLPIVEDRAPTGLEEVDDDGNIFIQPDRQRAALWEQVKAIRASKLLIAPTPFGPVQIDSESKENINGLVQMATLAKAAEADFDETFTMADNSEVAMTADQMIGFGIAVGSYISTVHARSRELRAALNSATTIVELNAVGIDSGWPS